MGPNPRFISCRERTDHVPDGPSVTGVPSWGRRRSRNGEKRTGRSCRGTFGHLDRRTVTVDPFETAKPHGLHVGTSVPEVPGRRRPRPGQPSRDRRPLV